MLIGFCLAVLSVAAAGAQSVPVVSYSDAFSSRYAEIHLEPQQFPKATPLEPAVRVDSNLGASSALILRTDGARIPYENAVAHIAVETELGSNVYLTFKGFRSVTASWVGERLLFIKRDIGHVAGIEEVFDVVEGRWLLQQSAHYRWP